MNWPAVRAVVAKDLTAVRRSKAVFLPMLLVPTLLLVVLPLIIGLAARAGGGGAEVSGFLDRLPGDLTGPITSRPAEEQLVLLVNGYLLAPLFLIVPLMVSVGAGAEMRRTLGTAVFAGMLGVTLFGIFLTPVFYYVIQWVKDARGAPEVEPEEEPLAVAHG